MKDSHFNFSFPFPPFPMGPVNIYLLLKKSCQKAISDVHYAHVLFNNKCILKINYQEQVASTNSPTKDHYDQDKTNPVESHQSGVDFGKVGCTHSLSLSCKL